MQEHDLSIDASARPDRVAAGPTGAYRAFGALRFGLALVVALGHARFLAPPAIGEFLSVWRAGTIGVMAFFVLSGFIISEALQTYYRAKPAAFIANRLLRLVPQFLLALAISIMLHAAFIPTPPGAFSPQTLAHQFVLLVFSWGPTPPAYYFVRYVWAVSVELWFYVLYALVFFTYLRSQTSDRGASLLFVAGVCLAYAAKRSEISWIYPIWMAPYFLLGIALYWFVTKRSVEALAAIAISSVATAWHVFDWYERTAYGAGAALVVLAVAATIAGLAQFELSQRAKKIDRILGDLSYPLYLNSFAVLMLFQTLSPPPGWLMWLLFGAASCGVAAVADYVVEPRVHALRTRLRGVEV